MLAVALDVLPVHLFAPLEDEAIVSVTTKHDLPSDHLRGWIRGDLFLPGSSVRAVAAEMPESEIRQLLKAQLASASGLTETERQALTERRREVFSRVAEQLGHSASEAIEDAVEEATKPRPSRRRRKEDHDG